MNASTSASVPPILATISVICGLSLTRSVTPVPMLPKAAPITANPTAQPIIDHRCSRQASANGPRRPAAASAGPGRGAMSPAPWSRRPTSTCATPTSAAARPSIKRKIHQRLSAYARVCCNQPTGDSQDNQLGPSSPLASPTDRSRNETPSTSEAIPVAVRAFSVSCTATAATAANTIPRMPSDRPATNEPSTGRSWPIIPAAVSSATTMFAPAATSSAAAMGACRPTTVAPISASRPASSSARVCRLTVMMLINATSSAPTIASRHITTAPGAVE
ncbi:MAG: hypothetical protein ABW215_08780 [Kibdelosporangium sp.]